MHHFFMFTLTSNGSRQQLQFFFHFTGIKRIPNLLWSDEFPFGEKLLCPHKDLSTWCGDNLWSHIAPIARTYGKHFKLMYSISFRIIILHNLWRYTCCLLPKIHRICVTLWTWIKRAIHDSLSFCWYHWIVWVFINIWWVHCAFLMCRSFMCSRVLKCYVQYQRSRIISSFFFQRDKLQL